jgi:hypothetical protein
VKCKSCGKNKSYEFFDLNANITSDPVEREKAIARISKINDKHKAQRERIPK